MKRKWDYWVMGILMLLLIHPASAQDSLLQNNISKKPSNNIHSPTIPGRKLRMDWTIPTSERKTPEKEKPKAPAAPVFNISEQTLRLIAFVVLFAILIIILLKAFGVTISWQRRKSQKRKNSR